MPKNGASFDPHKIQAITKWPILNNAIKVQSFLGLAGHYQRIVQDFSKIAMPLTNMTGKIVKNEWIEKT